MADIIENTGLCALCLKNKPLSDEHIIPYALGGRKKWKGICEDCNKALGSINAKFARHIYLRLARYGYSIKGRNKVKFDSILRVAEMTLGHIEFIPKSSLSAIELLPKIKENRGVEITFYHPAKLNDDAGNTLEGMLAMREPDDIDNMALFFSGVAYEVACMKHGSPYINESATAGKLRDALKKKDVSLLPFHSIRPEQKELYALLTTVEFEKYSYAILYGGWAIIGVLGVFGVVQYEETDPRFMISAENTTIIMFNFDDPGNAKLGYRDIPFLKLINETPIRLRERLAEFDPDTLQVLNTMCSPQTGSLNVGIREGA